MKIYDKLMSGEKMEIRESLEMYFSLVEDNRNQSYIAYKLSDRRR